MFDCKCIQASVLLHVIKYSKFSRVWHTDGELFEGQESLVNIWALIYYLRHKVQVLQASVNPMTKDTFGFLSVVVLSLSIERVRVRSCPDKMSLG